jgi:hypothetical protein
MQVTRENLDAELEGIRQAVGECAFWAMDCEFTGLNVRADKAGTAGTASDALDHLQERYAKQSVAAGSFLVLQFGLCCVRFDGKQWVAKTYSFYLFPSDLSGTSHHKEAVFSTLGKGRSFRLTGRAAACRRRHVQLPGVEHPVPGHRAYPTPLVGDTRGSRNAVRVQARPLTVGVTRVQHNYDFNKTFTQGIPFMPLTEYQRKLEALDKPWDRSKIVLSTEADRTFALNLKLEVMEWLGDAEAPTSKLIIAGENSFRRAYAYQVGAVELPSAAGDASLLGYSDGPCGTHGRSGWTPDVGLVCVAGGVALYSPVLGWAPCGRLYGSRSLTRLFPRARAGCWSCAVMAGAPVGPQGLGAALNGHGAPGIDPASRCGGSVDTHGARRRDLLYHIEKRVAARARRVSAQHLRGGFYLRLHRCREPLHAWGTCGFRESADSPWVCGFASGVGGHPGEPARAAGVRIAQGRGRSGRRGHRGGACHVPT